MSEFPALGAGSLRDGSHPSTLLSFSSIASGNQGLRDGRKDTADFTIDDFPALTPSNPAGMTRSAAMLAPAPRAEDMSLAAAAANGVGGVPNGAGSMQPVPGYGVPAGLGLQPARTGALPQQQPPNGPIPQGGAVGGKRPGGPGPAIGVGANYAAKAQQGGQTQEGSIPPGATIPPPGGLAPPPGTSLPTGGSGTPVPQPTSSPAPPSNGDKYGLFGLIDVIRMTDPDMNMLALGCDLTGLGLNLNSSDALYSTFMSPFADNPTIGADPQFTIPSCYDLPQPPPPAISKIGSFSDETLFYVFYAMPREGVQEAAAQELFNRAWRFHKELKLWVCKEPGMEAAVKGNGFERGWYIFFDPTTWSKVKREWVLYYDQLEERGPLGGGNVVNGRPGTPGVLGATMGLGMTAAAQAAQAGMGMGAGGMGGLGLTGMGGGDAGTAGPGGPAGPTGAPPMGLGLGGGGGPAGGLFQQQFLLQQPPQAGQIGASFPQTSTGGMGQAGGMWGGPTPAGLQGPPPSGQPNFFGTMSIGSAVAAGGPAGGAGGPPGAGQPNGAGPSAPQSSGVAAGR
ncbi:hypothetical protein HDV00_000981 [Rhizophlyctis rosea]|nr:hypothetical protein HDV00_000981 [Rhizophlyctis rosea]